MRVVVFKFDNEHLYVSSECGTKSEKGYLVIIEKAISTPLELLHIDLCGPLAVGIP